MVRQTDATKCIIYLLRGRSKGVLIMYTFVLVDEFMVVLLDSGKSEVVFTSVGVLINLMADEEKRPMLKKSDGIRG